MSRFPFGSVIGAVAFGAASLGCFYVAQRTSRGAIRVAALRVLTVQEAVAASAAAADPSDPNAGNELVAVRGTSALAPGAAELALPEDFSHVRLPRPLLAFREEFVLDIVTSAMQRKEARHNGPTKQTRWALQSNDGTLLLVGAELASSPPLRVLGRSTQERVGRNVDVGVRLRSSGVVSLVDMSDEEQVVSLERVPQGMLAGTALTAVATLGRDDAGQPVLLPARGEDAALCGIGEGTLNDRVADLRTAARLFRVLGGVCLIAAGFFAGNAARAFATRKVVRSRGSSALAPRYQVQVDPLAAIPAVAPPSPSAPSAPANAGAWPVPLPQATVNANANAKTPYPPASSTGYTPAPSAAPASGLPAAAPASASYTPTGSAINPTTWPYAPPNAGGSSGPAYRTVDEVAPKLSR